MKLIRKAEIYPSFVELIFKIENEEYGNMLLTSSGELYSPAAKMLAKEFPSLSEAEIKKLWKRLDLEFDENYSCGFVRVRKDKGEIKEVTRKVVNAFQRLIKNLKKLEKERDLSTWLKPKMEWEVGE